MIILTGNNLGKRHQELNAKVNEAASSNVNFDEIKAKEEKSDVDRLFKIDLASKYKNIEYIIEVLRSGDSLYIYRALKCSWIYDDKYSNLINSDYLHHHVFPFMSLKMKKKMLTAISVHVVNNVRATNFFEYCINIKMNEMALKFLVSTSDTFKVDFIYTKMADNDFIDNNYLVFLIGNSSEVADAYLDKISKYEDKNLVLHKFRYLYSTTGAKYLDLLEKYYDLEQTFYEFGHRISKEIIKAHKPRVLRNPQLFVNILSKKVISKNIKIVDAKTLTTALLPPDVKKFWDPSFCQTYKFILEIIPLTERFKFVKQAFSDKYPSQGFEMSSSFYYLNYHTLLMTEQERETWALRHIVNGEEILGVGKDYIWYKFVNFQKAFTEMKNFIRITQGQNERTEMIKILVQAAKNQEDLTKLLNYYYDRHINEAKNLKCKFLDSIFDVHDVFKFEAKCWRAFSQILYSMGIYDPLTNSAKEEYRSLALIYHIVHDEQIPDGLLIYLDNNLPIYDIRSQIVKLNIEATQKVYNFMIQFYLEKVKSFENETYDDTLQEKLRNYLKYSCEILHTFNKNAGDLPDILMKFIKLDWDHLKYNHIFDDMRSTDEMIENKLMRLLKQDSKLVVESLPHIKEKLDNYNHLYFNHVLKKLRIYFYNDVAKEYLDFFLKSVLTPNMTLSSYYALANVIFQLADDNFKVEFMLKYVPDNPKIDHYHIDSHLLHIRESICRFAYMSRPLMPLDNIIMYLKGDYIHYCLPMFNYILSNAPTNFCIEFVERILDSPLSLQKHGLRMAFKSFDLVNLKDVVLNVWKKTKSVSLRCILYKELFNKILSEDGNGQMNLFDTLNMFNLDLNENDDKEIFVLLTTDKLPEKIRGAYLESGWQSITSFPQKTKNWERQSSLISCLEENICLIRQDVISSVVEKHIEVMLIDKEIRPKYAKYEINQLNEAKWELVARYIMYFDEEGKLNRSKYLVKHILKNAFEMWNIVHDGIYTLRDFTETFIRRINNYRHWKNYKNENEVFTTILNLFLHNFPIEQIYLTVWDLRLKIIARNIIYEAKTNNQSFDAIANNFAKDLADLIKEYVEKNIFYISLINEISMKIKDTEQFLYVDEYDKNLLVIVAGALTTFEMRETYLLAIHILPSTSPENCSDIYKEVMDKIKRFQDQELCCIVYEKLVNSDFRNRNYV